ncbi:CD2-associated protein-like [Coccinella septempunctata]|uniref:CD2-associated protein-like n=1 Tax=Coccinella septempunctata TaxID=41139 RepID=UPI001D06EA17|nr:CD2-associated protein-like [Coccinella septempunctata]
MDMDTGVIMRNKKDSKRIRQCRVVFSYKQDHEDELNLNVGDIIEILGEEEEGWWRGVLNGKIGVFPSNFVEEIHADKLKSSREDLNVSSEGDTSFTSPLKLAKILCEVKYSYKAQNEDELSLREGDVITLLSKDGQDPGWWKGELNGVVGVFPDNFVVILPHNHEKGTSDKSPVHDPHAIKPSSIASQRKSLDNKLQNHSDKADSLAQGDTKSTPPSVPTKKPSIAVKKSPSSGSSGGLFSGFKKKIVDVVDGATSSKSSFTPPKGESENSENVFDQVERISMLTDVRATRPKAPAGRRPPSMVFKDEEPTLPNGNAPVEPLNLDMVSEMATSTSSDTDASEVKPKLREWEKHKAPWLAEMKLNQAKRTSPSPGTSENRPKFANSDEDQKPSEMSKSMTSITSTPPTSKVRDVDKTPLRPKPNVVSPSQRPATSPVTPSPECAQKPTTPTHVKASPPVPKVLPSPAKTATNDVKTIDQDVTITFKQYTDLVERIHKLELLVEKQNVIHMTAIDELKGKLQLETELRHMLQGSRESSSETRGTRHRRVPWEGGYISLHIYNILFIVATLLGFVISFLIYYWVDYHRGGFSLDKVWTSINWHPLLMFVGPVFMYAQAILFDQTGRNLPKWCGTYMPNSDIFWFALILKIVCLIAVGLGLQVVVDYNNLSDPPKTHVYSLHSWIGICAIFLSCLDVLADLKWFFLDAVSDLNRDVLVVLSWMLSTMTFLASVNASITGFMIDAVGLYGAEYRDLPPGAILVNVVGLLVVVFAVVILHMSRKMREVGNLSGDPENAVVIVEGL